jgi:hypothetical protein
MNAVKMAFSTDFKTEKVGKMLVLQRDIIFFSSRNFYPVLAALS